MTKTELIIASIVFIIILFVFYYRAEEKAKERQMKDLSGHSLDSFKRNRK